jgi:hypothetical protein
VRARGGGSAERASDPHAEAVGGSSRLHVESDLVERGKSRDASSGGDPSSQVAGKTRDDGGNDGCDNHGGKDDRTHSTEVGQVAMAAAPALVPVQYRRQRQRRWIN